MWLGGRVFKFGEENAEITFSSILTLVCLKDTVGGRFDATQAFVGEMSQFNIWDRVLKAEDIVNIANCSTNMPGNIIPWVDNNVDVFGGATKWPVETCEERLLDL